MQNPKKYFENMEIAKKSREMLEKKRAEENKKPLTPKQREQLETDKAYFKALGEEYGKK